MQHSWFIWLTHKSSAIKKHFYLGSHETARKLLADQATKATKTRPTRQRKARDVEINLSFSSCANPTVEWWIYKWSPNVCTTEEDAQTLMIMIHFTHLLPAGRCNVFWSNKQIISKIIFAWARGKLLDYSVCGLCTCIMICESHACFLTDFNHIAFSASEQRTHTFSSGFNSNGSPCEPSQNFG